MSEGDLGNLRVLLVEDSPDDAELILRALRKGGYKVEYERVDEREALVEALETGNWDLVISDYSMPRLTGLEALNIVQGSGIDLPFIVVSGAIGEDVAVEVMKAGAYDYLMKSNLRRLVPAIQRELREVEERQARRLAEQTLRYRAYHDALTGLPNRWLLADRLAQVVALARRERRMVGLLFIDLDRFKDINDTLGHLVGDQLLRAVAARIVDLLQEGDTLARLTGDDFALVLSDISDPEAAMGLAQKIIEVLKPPFDLLDREVHVTASIGIALFPHHGGDVDSLLRHSEFAMYSAKAQGRKNIQFYTAEAHAAAHERFHIEHDLHQAIEQDGLQLHYQPQVDLNTGAVVGVEALVRWPHPRRGMIPPLKFIPIAEETGLIVPLGDWVFARAFHDYARWQEIGCAPRRLAINLSVRQIRSEETVHSLRRLMERYGVDPRVLEVEITESSLMQNPDEAVKTIAAIRDLGSRIAIDDFGTGYSSLAQLRRLPLDVLKIDRSFTRDIAVDFDDAAIVAAILAMAGNLGLQVVAEGVEQPAQESFLREHGCAFGQGYLFARPVPSEEVVEYLRQGYLQGAR